MIFSGVPEIAALSCDWKNNHVYGVRLKHRSRGNFVVTKFAQSGDPDWVKAANRVLRELGVNSSVYLSLAVVPERSEVFECEIPAAAGDVVREALRFEVPRHVLSVPEDFRLQYIPCSSSGGDGLFTVRCAVFPEESLLKICNQLRGLRSKVDCLINPLLTLPQELSEDAVVSLHGFDEKFAWKNGHWQLQEDSGKTPVNCELDKLLEKHCSGAIFDGADWQHYRTALTAAWFGACKLFVDSAVQNAVTVLPDYMRPARYRTQLRLMALLLLLLAGWAVFRYGGSAYKKISEYSRLSGQVNARRSEVQKLRKQLKNGEKELKETIRVAELTVGSRECLGHMGHISQKIPGDVLVTSYRWNEGVLDISYQSTSTQDMLSFFNQLPGMRVISASTPRSNLATNFTTGNVKLSVFDPAEERTKARLKLLLKSKDKAKGRDKKK